MSELHRRIRTASDEPDRPPKLEKVDSASDIDEEPEEPADSNKQDESKFQKMLTRAVFGSVMSFFLIFILYMGAVYVCVTVVAIQVELFRELVNVRYKRAKDLQIPLFRTLQWTWFYVAMFFTYGDFLHSFCLEHKAFLWLAQFTQYHTYITFAMYSMLFVTTVLTLRPGLVKFQLNQMMWTIVTLCLIVGQCKFIAFNIFDGLYWFFFPVSVVIMNDVSAYFCGITFGRKFITYPFFQLSPKKTWEGFIGSFICTTFFAFFFSKYLAQFRGLTCPVEELRLLPHTPTCDPQYVFIPREYALGRYTLTLLPIQIHAVAYGLFASSVAPFGGFLASAIKRAYGIKDFDSFIPGHGGVMDRMDCQLIMMLFTFVHHNTFIKTQMVTVTRLLASSSLLSLTDQEVLYEQLGAQIAALKESLAST